MTFGVAGRSDEPGISALWKRVFGDDRVFIHESLNVFAGEGNVFVARGENGQVAAQLLAVPCTLSGAQGIYLYALATAPQQRGRGVMAELMACAEAAVRRRGARFAVLIPAGAELFGYYERRGFLRSLYLRELMWAPGRPEAALSPPACAPQAAQKDYGEETPAGEAIAELRRRFIPGPYVDFSIPRYAVLMRDLAEAGVQLARTKAAYALYAVRGQELLVPEVFAKNDDEAERLLGCLCHAHDCTAARLTLAQSGGPFSAQGTLRPAALLKNLDPAFSAEYAYIRFGFDEWA